MLVAAEDQRDFGWVRSYTVVPPTVRDLKCFETQDWICLSRR